MRSLIACPLPEAKNAARLLERLREGKIGTTDEQIAEFWEDLTGVIQDSLEQWRKTIDPPSDLPLLIEIVDEILEVTDFCCWFGGRAITHWLLLHIGKGR